ncbi:hypothetical protein B0H19DRAFT_1079310 [Mycena capillaripes]|nr:hypothetical protein B0H19DRAFT_1079310 [Mycena capillaripes]
MSEDMTVIFSAGVSAVQHSFHSTSDIIGIFPQGDSSRSSARVTQALSLFPPWCALPDGGDIGSGHCCFSSGAADVRLAGCLQAWYYFRTYRNDMRWIKSLVAFVIVCDTAQQALTTAYSYTITNFGNPSIRSHLFRSVFAPEDILVLIVQQNLGHPDILQRFYRGIGSAVCYPDPYLKAGPYFPRSFYANRVYRGNTISRLLSFSLNFGSPMSELSEFATLQALTLACNIAAAVTNVLISMFLVYYLYILKRGDRKTDDIINRLIAFAFNTVYTNSLLVTLNTRNYVRSVIAPSTELESERKESVHYPSTILHFDSTYGPRHSAPLSPHTDSFSVGHRADEFTQSKSKHSVARQ